MSVVTVTVMVVIVSDGIPTTQGTPIVKKMQTGYLDDSDYCNNTWRYVAQSLISRSCQTYNASVPSLRVGACKRARVWRASYM